MAGGPQPVSIQYNVVPLPIVTNAMLNRGYRTHEQEHLDEQRPRRTTLRARIRTTPCLSARVRPVRPRRRAVLRDQHRADHRSGALRARRRDRARRRGVELRWRRTRSAAPRRSPASRLSRSSRVKSPADLVLHQLGGTLPDGRFFKLWGRPEYQAGHEVIVFAIARPEGDYQTAELLLGKFEVQQDEQGRSFAVPSLVADAPGQVTVTQRSPGDATAAVAPASRRWRRANWAAFCCRCARSTASHRRARSRRKGR